MKVKRSLKLQQYAFYMDKDLHRDSFKKAIKEDVPLKRIIQSLLKRWVDGEIKIKKHA